MAFVRACDLADVPADEGVKVTLGRYDVVVCRDVDDIYALQDLCTHGQVALSEGEVANCQIECWLHGSKFDLRSGKPTNLPATEPVSTFPVEIRDVDGAPTVFVDVDTTLNGVTPS